MAKHNRAAFDRADIEDAKRGYPDVYEIAPRGVPHGRDLLSGRASLGHFADAYHRFLGRVEADHRDCAAIDVHAAVPVAGAVHLGRGLMRDAQPALRVHDRDSDGRWAQALVLGRLDV